MCFAPGRISLLGPIAEKHPQLTLILDHMGVTASMVKDNKVEEAIGQTVALAKYPNVSVKLSASPGISREPYPFRDVTVHIKRVFDAYGPQRSYWGTDMTNSYAKASYRQRISHFTEELGFLSESDKDWVMGRAIVAAPELDVIRSTPRRVGKSAQFQNRASIPLTWKRAVPTRPRRLAFSTIAWARRYERIVVWIIAVAGAFAHPTVIGLSVSLPHHHQRIGAGAEPAPRSWRRSPQTARSAVRPVSSSSSFVEPPRRGRKTRDRCVAAGLDVIL